MVQDVHGAPEEEGVPPGKGVLEGLQEGGEPGLDRDVRVHGHDDLGEHHLPQAQHPVGHLVGLAGVGLPQAHVHPVVGHPLGGHVVVHHLGEDEAEGGEEEPFRGLNEVGVLHGGTPTRVAG